MILLIIYFRTPYACPRDTISTYIPHFFVHVSVHVHFACHLCLGPFVFLLDAAEFISSALQLLLKALNANNRLQQVLMEVGILFLQGPTHRGMITGPIASEKLLECIVTIHSSLNKSLGRLPIAHMVTSFHFSSVLHFILCLCLNSQSYTHTMFDSSNNGLTISIYIGVM